MNCPTCHTELQSGKATVFSTQGAGQMLLTFTSDAEASKSIFKQKSHSKLLFPGIQAEAFYCPSCKTILTIMKED